MATIQITGHVGKVEAGVSSSQKHFIRFSLAERFSYFSEQANEWIEKGTQWHDCVFWCNSPEQHEQYSKFITKGNELLIAGKTSINPSDEKNENGKSKYLNPYVNVSDVALTIRRLESATKKESQQSNQHQITEDAQFVNDF